MGAFGRFLGRAAPRLARGAKNFFGGVRQGAAGSGAGATQQTLPGVTAGSSGALGQAYARGAASRAARTSGKTPVMQRAAEFAGKRPVISAIAAAVPVGFAGSSIYNRVAGPSGADVAELLGTSPSAAGTGTGPGGMSIEDQLALMEMSNQRTRDALAGMSSDTSVRDRIMQDLTAAQGAGEAYVGARAPALRREFEQYGAETGQQADMLRRLAEAASGTISGTAEEGASDVEEMLYSSPPASAVSGLAPLPSYLSDIPDVARAEGDIASRSALRDLMGSADTMQFAADQAGRYGAGYSGELADEMALQQMALSAAASGAIRDDEAGLRNLSRQMQLEQAGQMGQMEFSLRMDKAASAKQDEQILQRVLANADRLDELAIEWENLGTERQALLAQQGIDFRRFVIERQKEALGIVGG